MLGNELFRLARSADPQSALIEAADRPLRRLRDRADESALLAIVTGRTAMEIVTQLDGAHRLGVVGWVGADVPLHASSAGKLVLAELSQSELEAWFEEAQPVRLYSPNGDDCLRARRGAPSRPAPWLGRDRRRARGRPHVSLCARFAIARQTVARLTVCGRERGSPVDVRAGSRRATPPGEPGYPAELFAVLEERCGLAEGTTVVEIGPGTGQATAELLRRGAHVHAVEPGPGLARHLLASMPGSRSRSRSARSRTSCFRMLKQTSWSPRRRSTGSSPRSAYRRCWRRFGPAVGWRSGGTSSTTRVGPDEFSRALDPIFEEFGDVESPAFVDTRQEEHWLPLLREAGFERRGAERFPWEVEQTTDDIVALFSTFSNMRMRPAAERTQVLARIGAVADDQFGGRVRRTYQAALYTGRKPGG